MMNYYTLQDQADGTKKLVMQAGDIPTPTQSQVLVKVAAVSLNFRDYNIVRGRYPDPLPSSFIPVSDGAGEVVAAGEDVTHFAVGQRVASHFLPKWRDGEADYETLGVTMGGPLQGMLSQYALVDEDALIELPDYLSFAEAATLPIAAVTAWNAIRSVDTNPSRTIVVQGTGGVALFAVQFAKLHGARVIVLSSSTEKAERVKQLGADSVINYKTTPEWPQEILALTNGRGADAVLDVAGMSINQSLRALRPGGIVCAIGLLEGHTPELNILPLLQHQKQIKGITIGSHMMFTDMLRAMQEHQIHPIIDTAFAFENAAEAFDYLASGQQFGKVVVSVEAA